MRRLRQILFALLAVPWLAACGSAPPKPEAAAPPAASSAPAPAAPIAEASAPAAAEKPKEVPFAKTNAEAMSYIDEALEEHRPKVAACVTAARGRSATPDATLAVDITIDQTGKLIGVNAPKGTKGDPLLNTCIREAIAGARFPKSNTGLITIKRTFEKRWSTPTP